MDWSQEEEVSKGTGSPCFSLQWTRWTTIKAWKKFHANWTSQGSHHTQILGDLIKIQCIGAIWSSLRRKDCNFIKHDHTQSFSATQNLRFVLWKRYTWRLRRSYTTKSSKLQGWLKFFWSRIRKVDKRIKAEARKSFDHQSVSGSYGETRSGNVDYRIPGIPQSTVQQQNTNRKETVKKLIQQFENHPNQESFLQDLIETEKTNTFSEESKKLITNVGNTEIFELCETSSKKQSPDCDVYWEIGIVCCSCGRCRKPQLVHCRCGWKRSGQVHRIQEAFKHPKMVLWRRARVVHTCQQTFEGKCTQIHLPHATFSHAQSLHRSHSKDDMCAWLKFELRHHNRSSTHASCFTLHLTAHWTPAQVLSLLTSLVLLSSSSLNPDLLSTHPLIDCQDPRRDGTSTEFHSSTCYEPKRIGLNRLLVNPQNQITDDQDDFEEIDVKPLSCSQSLAESIATPPDSDLEDEQLRKMLASPL